MADSAGALACPEVVVQPEWIDYNGHMNMAYYSLVFDKSLDHVLARIGLDENYLREGQGSSFTLEVHVTYLREVKLGDPLRIEFQLLNVDSKRMHYFGRMYHAREGYLAATSEQISLHVDMTTRRAAPYPAPIKAQLDALLEAHRQLPQPAQVGHRIGIPTAVTTPAQ